jgi:glucose-1-phosphate thymidylyltransferase
MTRQDDRKNRGLKGLVLAGGHGTRLRPITHTSAKQLIPVANKPVLFYGLESLREAGITRIGIIVGETAREVMAVVGDGSELGIQVTYIPQEAPLGLAHCVLIAREFLGDDDFVMYLGDNFLIGGIVNLVDEYLSGESDAEILLTKVREPEHFGIAELNSEGRVLRVVEKSSHPPSDMAVVGVYVFGQAIHEAVRAITPSRRGELEITDAIQWLISQGKSVGSREVSGYWKDTGRLEDMLECNRTVLELIEADLTHGTIIDSEVEGRVVLEPGAVIERSRVRGPAIVGKGTRVTDSYVGPYTSIHHSCTIDDSEIEHSIILERTTIRGARRLQDSLIGKEVEIVRGKSHPAAYRMMIGDNSQVSLP